MNCSQCGKTIYTCTTVNGLIVCDWCKPRQPASEWWAYVEHLIPVTEENAHWNLGRRVVERDRLEAELVRNIHEHNEAMNNTIRLYEAKLANLVAEVKWSLKNEAKCEAKLSERLEQVTELQREVERLRAALELIRETGARAASEIASEALRGKK